jgi:organic hydroperoxide reductase OsmC/OhrA
MFAPGNLEFAPYAVPETGFALWHAGCFISRRKAVKSNRNNEDTQMAVNKKSLTLSKSTTQPATAKSAKVDAAPSPATAATALRFGKSFSRIY